MKYEVGQKLIRVDNIGEILRYKGLYHILRVNTKTYTLNDGSLIDKGTLRMKTRYLEYTHIVPTNGQIKEFVDEQIMLKKTLCLQNFKKELEKNKEIIEFYLQHKDKIQLDNDEIISNLECALESMISEWEGINDV